MLSETYFVSVAGPPISNNTAISKDAGVYEQVLHPSHSTSAVFKKSSVPRNGLAVNDTHVFAAQEEKSTIHVYSRAKGNQEALVTFPERIRSINLQDDLLILGSQEGRLIIWEICTGRQITTPAGHVQAITCLAATPFHVISGSDDSNIHVWSLPHLLDLNSTVEHEPELTLSHHRAAITSVVVGSSVNPDTNICVSSSADKSCIVWNYQSGIALRTLLFPTSPLCLCLDPCSRAFYVSSDDGSLFAIELFDEKPLLGSGTGEDSSMAVQVSSAFGAVPKDVGPATCLALSYDGTVMISGHPKGQVLRWDLGSRMDSTELANLNASVTNLNFVSPLPELKRTRPGAVVKPFLGTRSYNATVQLVGDLTDETTNFTQMLQSRGLPKASLEDAIISFQQPVADSVGDPQLRKENEELWEVINEQRALQKQTMEKYIQATSNKA